MLPIEWSKGGAHRAQHANNNNAESNVASSLNRRLRACLVHEPSNVGLRTRLAFASGGIHQEDGEQRNSTLDETINAVQCDAVSCPWRPAVLLLRQSDSALLHKPAAMSRRNGDTEQLLQESWRSSSKKSNLSMGGKNSCT